ncbi:MAG: hypothetical protein DRO99_01995 [Candidatus Aenigmatarchaeota archaeon]|mgnify:CR=1 FL=1|nr:MAG: hypothetical protein DRO99_01995 [Candidatus Aenigmarchaeota archaeon]
MMAKVKISIPDPGVSGLISRCMKDIKPELLDKNRLNDMANDTDCLVIWHNRFDEAVAAECSRKGIGVVLIKSMHNAGYKMPKAADRSKVQELLWGSASPMCIAQVVRSIIQAN